MLDPELGPFLRSRRDALSPADVGLPNGPRRRTPGLRRAEVATLAGISVDYLIRLEQGRDRHPSAQVLAALGNALRLDGADLDHLRHIAAISNGEELCPAAIAAARSVRPMVQAVLDRLEPTPAFVMNRLTDLLAWTNGFEALVRPMGILDADGPNLLGYTFGDPRARTTYPDWEAVADEQVGNLQAVFRPDDAEGQAFIDRLAERAGTAFTTRWAARPIVRTRIGVKRLSHPEVGDLRVAFETLQLPDADDQRLVVYLPADDGTAEAFDRLTGRHPGSLRAVPG